MTEDLRNKMKKKDGKIVCPNCSQLNAPEAGYCWACYMDFVVDVKPSENKKAAVYESNGPGDFFRNEKFMINQVKELGEILVDWEFANKYDIYDTRNKIIGQIREQKKSLAHAFFIRRWGKCRNYDITFYDNTGEQIMVISRPITFFGMSNVKVIDPMGRKLATIKRQFPPLIKRVYVVFDAVGSPAGFICGTLLHPWTFRVYDISEIEVAVIRKKWSGVFKEVFTDTDNFTIDIVSPLPDDNVKKIILAAAVMIDFDFFETSPNR